MPPYNKKPWWLAVLIIALVLPVFSFPVLLSQVSASAEEAKVLLWLYLFYVPGTGILAWISWPERKYITWMLLVLMLMSHLAMWTLVGMKF